MGSCSSKPKTADFEGLMQTREETSQEDEDAGNSVDVERVGLGGALYCMEKQQINAEIEQNDLINKKTETQNNSRAAYDFEGESVVENKALEDVKQVVGKEINGVNASGLTERTLMPFMEANIVNSVLHRSSESEPGTVLSESVNSVAQKNISIGPGADHCQERDLAVLNESRARPKDRCEEEAKILKFQQPVSLEDTELQLHMILPEEIRSDAAVLESQEHRLPIARSSSWEEMKVGTFGLNSQDKPNRKGNNLVESESEEEAPHGNDVLRLVKDPEQKMLTEECMDCDVAAMGARMFSDSSGQSEIGIMAPRGSNMSYQETQGLALPAAIAVPDNGVLREPSNQQDEVGGSCSQLLNNGACMLSYTEQSENEKSLLLGKNQNVEGEGNSITNDCEPSQNHACNGGLHEEWMQAKVVHRPGNTFAFAENLLHDDSISRDLLPVKNNDLQTDLHAGVVSDDSWYILEKDDFEYCDPLLMVLKDPKQCTHQNNGNDVALEIRGTVTVLDDKAADHRVNPLVQVAAKSKLVANCVPVWDPFELGSNHKLVQEISAVDIDDILEKLASEFERQESLAHSVS